MALVQLCLLTFVTLNRSNKGSISAEAGEVFLKIKGVHLLSLFSGSYHLLLERSKTIFPFVHKNMVFMQLIKKLIKKLHIFQFGLIWEEGEKLAGHF